MVVHPNHAVAMKTDDLPATPVGADHIIAFVDRVAAGFKPQRIVLFGSYACGKPTADSDVDLLITRRRWSMSPASRRLAVRRPAPPADFVSQEFLLFFA
jgi:uncharacterized protein